MISTGYLPNNQRQCVINNRKNREYVPPHRRGGGWRRVTHLAPVPEATATPAPAAATPAPATPAPATPTTPIASTPSPYDVTQVIRDSINNFRMPNYSGAIISDKCYTPHAMYPVTYSGLLQLPLKAGTDEQILKVALEVIHSSCMFRMEWIGVCPYELSYAIQIHLYLLHIKGEKFCGTNKNGGHIVDKAVMSQYVMYALMRTKLTTDQAQIVLNHVIAAIYRWR